MMNYEIATHLSGARKDTPSSCRCEADEVSRSNLCGNRGLPRSRLPARRMTPAGEPSLGGQVLAMTVKFEIKLSENPKTRGKPLTRRGDVIYSICQLNGQ